MRFLNGIMEVTHAHRLSTDPYVHLDALWLDVYHIVIFFLASFVILCVLWTSSKYLFWTPPYTVDIQDTFTPLQKPHKHPMYYLKTLFLFPTNETGNVMLHLCTAVLFIKKLTTVSREDNPLLFYTTVSVIFSMLCSVTFHLFKPMSTSSKHYSLLLQLDVFSVVVAQSIFYFATVQCGFHDNPWLPHFLAKCAILSFVTIALSVSIQSISLRALAMLLQLFGRWLTQIVRKVYLIGNQDSLNFYFATEMLVFLGGLINVARFPERYNSGNYDTFLNSHQIMHLLVSVSLIIAFNAIAADEVTRKISV